MATQHYGNAKHFIAGARRCCGVSKCSEPVNLTLVRPRLGVQPSDLLMLDGLSSTKHGFPLSYSKAR